MKFQFVLFSIIIFISNISFGQFSLKTEYDYLALINFQQDKKLIKSSAINAEIAANNLILKKNSSLNSLFYNELSKSYSLTNNFEKSIYFQILQRILFNNDSITNTSKNRFYNSGYKSNLTKLEIDYFWNNTNKEKIPNSKNEQLLKAIKLGTKLFSKKLTSQILQLGNLLKKQNYKMPQWYQDWEYLTTIGIKEKHKRIYMNYDNNTSTLFTRLKKTEKIKLYNKSINYYIKKHAFNKSKNLISELKKEKRSFLNKSGLIIKRITTIYHKII
jgi:hypothetical protein